METRSNSEISEREKGRMEPRVILLIGRHAKPSSSIDESLVKAEAGSAE